MASRTPLTEAELRGLVRDTIARVRAGGGMEFAAERPSPLGSTAALSEGTPVRSADVAVHVHASQALFVLGPGGDADGNCLIEPAVRCTHCGFCQTLGH